MGISTIKDLRPYANEVIRGLGIFGLPKIEALLHVLRYVQGEQVMFEHRQPIWTRSAFNTLRIHQDILRHLIYKIHQWCPEGGDIACLTRRADLQQAEAAVIEFEAYSVLHDFINNTEGGFSTCTITEGRVIQFDSVLSPSSMARIIAEEKNQMQLIYTDEAPQEAAQRVLSAFGSKKVEIRSNASVAYTVTDRLFNLFYRDDAPTLFPSGLQMRSYTWGEFHVFWQYIKSLCELRHYVLTLACNELGGHSTAYNSGAIFIEAAETKRMRHRVGLRYGSARAIFQDLTYSPSIATDIIQQPLIRLTDRLYVTAPLLIYGNNHERNFLLVANKLDATSGRALNEAKEHLMLEELQPLFEERGLHVRPRLRLGFPPNEIGDIDLLVWNRDATIALGISLKWLFGPDSVYEVKMHDEKFREALEIHRRCLQELDAKKVALARNFHLNPPFSADTKVLGVIVSKMARPSELVKDDEIPIVTSEELKSCLKDADLYALFDKLRRVPEILPPLKGRDIFKEVRFGDYLFRIPQFALDREDPEK